MIYWECRSILAQGIAKLILARVPLLNVAATDPVNAMLDEFLVLVQATYHAFILARTSHELGASVVDALADDVLVTGSVGLNIAIEPIPVSQLRKFKATYPDFVVDIFHGKLVQHWQDLLDGIFAHYVDLHVANARPFVELGNTQVKVDFANAVPIQVQLRESLCHHFQFRKYAERQKLVAKVRDAASEARTEADTIHRHVHFRNAIQHHQGVLREFVFKELGRQDLTVLDDSGATQSLMAGHKIVLSVPEFDDFRRALLVVTQRWKSP